MVAAGLVSKGNVPFHQPLGGTGLVRTETSISALEFRCSFVGTLHATNFRGRVSLLGALPPGHSCEFRCGWILEDLVN